MGSVGPRLSIVTPSFNQVGFLRGLVENIRQQRCANLQHIVVDGGSTDGTVEFLQANSDCISWVSEPDRGQAHAINKGFAIAEAGVVGWINCDDRYTTGALNLVVEYFERLPEMDFLYGDALGADVSGQLFGLRAHVRACGLEDLVTLGDPIVQPASFWRRHLWQRVGELDESLVYAFDYEYWMRVAALVDLTYVPVCFAIESLHGEAKTTNGDISRVREIEDAARRHGGTGIPIGFRAEAAALETRDGLKALFRGDFSGAKEAAAASLDLRPSMTRYAAHSAALLFPSAEAVPKLRLWANRLRARRRPVLPLDVRDVGMLGREPSRVEASVDDSAGA